MPSVTLIRFDGTEEEIARFLTQNINAVSASSVQASNTANQANGTWDQIAVKFEGFVSEAAAAGRPGQKDAMLAWLRAGGCIQLTKLWNAAGVRTQHDYAGVGGSLTKNMVKAKGPRAWYTWHRKGKSGEWIYEIVPDLREPLKSAFGL